MQRTPPPFPSRSHVQQPGPGPTTPEAQTRTEGATPSGAGSRPHPNPKPRPPASKSQFPLALMQARLSRGWTQQQLADLLETTPQTVSRWERGTATPGPYHQGKLHTLFGLSLAELNSCFNEADEASPENEADETNPENEAETTAANEAAGATIGLASERKPDPDSSQRLAASAPPAPVVHPRRPAFLWRLIVGACAVAFLVAFLALIALNGQWQPAPLAPGTAPKAARPQPASLGAVGIIAFKSSGDFAGNSAAGMNDEVAIHLFGVPIPPSGTSYFAWMSGASGSEAIWTPLGRQVWPVPEHEQASRRRWWE